MLKLLARLLLLREYLNIWLACARRQANSDVHTTTTYSLAYHLSGLGLG